MRFRLPLSITRVLHGRARRALAPAIALGAMIAVVGATGIGANAASSSTVVSATIPSSVSLANGCTASTGWNLGTVMPGSTATTTTGAGVCRFTFGSSNDTAMLRIGQKDAKGTAMGSSDSRNMDLQSTFGGFSISMATATDGWAEGNGTTYRTSNGGTTWSAVAGPGVAVLDLLAVNATTVVVASYGGVIRRWTDGSGVWTTIASGTTETIVSLTKTSASNLYGTAEGSTIIKSTDGGATWTAQVIGGSSGLGAISGAPGTNIVYAVDGDNSRLIKTTDGVTWAPTTGNGYVNFDVSTFDGTTVYMTSATGNVWVSNDGGANWTQHTLPGISASFLPFVDAVEATAAGTAYVLGPRGVLVKTADSGNTWIAQTAATTNGIRDATSVAGSVWASGNGGVIVNTTDGTNWTRQRVDEYDLFSVSAVNADVAWAVGSGGTIRKTTNGSTWNNQASGITTSLNSISAVSPTRAFAVGSSGKILATSDGTTWAVQVPGPAAELWGVAAVDTNTAWAVGDSGTILRTTDGGANWTTQTSGTGVRLLAVAAADNQRVYAVGDGGTILKTTNGGTTWTAQASGTGQNLVSVTVAPGTDDAWAGAASSGNEIRHTSDGGATPWQAQTGLGCCTKYALSAVDARTVFNGEDGCTVGKSIDGGATFDYLNPVSCDRTWGVSAVDANLAWFVGENGAIAKTLVDRPVTDYGGGSNWAGAPGLNAFGVCVQDVALSGVIAAPWVEDTVTTPGVCNAVDTDPWAAIPVAQTKLATTAAAGQNGQVDLVWGFKAASDQPKGAYTATILIEALAPNV